jgi:hypothetical protein
MGILFIGKISDPRDLKGILETSSKWVGIRIKKIRSDNRTEFKNSQIEGFLEEEGIKHEFSSPYTPQQNGVVERNNRTLLDMARTMLDEYKTPDRFWAESINTACYSINRLYLHRILKNTSYELLTGKKPNVPYFRVFGSKCFILVTRGRKSKFAPKAVEGLLLGYDSNTRAYRVFNKSTRLVEVSCDIVFDETNGSQVEQVDLDELDDEEALCVALRNMSIGMCILRNLKSLHKHKINHHLQIKHLHQLKMRIRLKTMKKKIKKMSHLKKRTIIKGEMWSAPNPLWLKCDTITSPKRLVNTFIHQLIPDLLKWDKPIKVANNFKSWSTARDISSEWGWSSPIYAAKQISGPTATCKVGNNRNSYPISFFWKTTNKQGWVQTYSASHLHPRNGEIRYNAWNMWSSGYFAETTIFYAGLFCKTFCIFQSASSPKGAGSFFSI